MSEFSKINCVIHFKIHKPLEGNDWRENPKRNVEKRGNSCVNPIYQIFDSDIFLNQTIPIKQTSSSMIKLSFDKFNIDLIKQILLKFKACDFEEHFGIIYRQLCGAILTVSVHKFEIQIWDSWGLYF